MKTGMAPRLVQALAAHGMPVVAVNTLTAYADGRDAARTRDLIATATQRALALPGTARVVLIGQSFGADMLQVGLVALPPPLRARVAQVILVVPGDSVTFRATPGGFLNGAPAYPALPTARRLDWAPVTCIDGATEADSLCPLLRARNVRIETLPGDHYLNHDAARLSAALWQAIARRG
ncbi:AcvB/VirJ family lysyl-phosphatidylglycerol hydrolase [Sphingomonas sp. MMS24-JH45]